MYYTSQFNLSILDDKQVSSELKRSLEGRIPSPDQPVCIEIQMETPGVGCVSLHSRLHWM